MGGFYFLFSCVQYHLLTLSFVNTQNSWALWRHTWTKTPPFTYLGAPTAELWIYTFSSWNILYHFREGGRSYLRWGLLPVDEPWEKWLFLVYISVLAILEQIGWIPHSNLKYLVWPAIIHIVVMIWWWYIMMEYLLRLTILFMLSFSIWRTWMSQSILLNYIFGYGTSS